MSSKLADLQRNKLPINLRVALSLRERVAYIASRVVGILSVSSDVAEYHMYAHRTPVVLEGRLRFARTFFARTNR